KIGRPPGNAGRVPREENDMLPGAAAGLEHVACLAAQEFFENRPDRDMVAVKRCRVEPFIGGSTPAVVAEFTVVGHGRIAFIPRESCRIVGPGIIPACQTSNITPTELWMH